MNKKAERLKYIMDNCEVEYSDKLQEINFKCYFSKYLYLILKQRLMYLNWNNNEGRFKLALPVEVNVGRLIKEYKVCRNIFRKAIKELITVGLIEKVDWLEPSHSACFMVLVNNDALIESYHSEYHIVSFTKTLSFNFADEELQ
ncbi:MAG: hypothetical protein NTY74_13890 [Ignavibacteriae bacterium]|nr:hypothetical protein [Ignavibacteriota bacterium]